MDTTTRVQILNEDVCISHNANTFGKGVTPAVPPLAMSK